MSSEFVEHWKHPMLAGGLAFVIGIVCTAVARYVGLRFKIVDKPDGYRKVHEKAIPTTGGYAVFAAFAFVMVALFTVFPHFQNQLMGSMNAYLMLLAGALLTLAMGALDDVKDIRPRYKLLFQLVAALFAYYGGFQIKILSNPFGSAFDLGYLSLPITVFWFMGCMNAINLLDGMDGLAGGISFFAGLTMASMLAIKGSMLEATIMAGLCGAVLAFLIFNFHPASIFLGDAGSMFIGFVIAAMGLKGSAKASTAVALLIPVIILGLPVFDTLLAMLRRWSRRVPISAADKRHLHHMLLGLGLGQKRVAMILYMICLLFGACGLLLTVGQNGVAMLILAALGVTAVFGVRALGLIDVKQLRDRIVTDLNERSAKNNARVVVERCLHDMSESDEFQQLWQAMGHVFAVLELDHAVFDPAENVPLSRKSWFTQASTVSINAVLIRPEHKGHIMDKWSLCLNVHSDDRSFGTLEVWKKGEGMPIRDTATLLNKVRHHMSVCLNAMLLEHRSDAHVPTKLGVQPVGTGLKTKI